MNKATNKNNPQDTSFHWNKITNFCFVIQEIKINNFELEDLINDQIQSKPAKPIQNLTDYERSMLVVSQWASRIANGVLFLQLLIAFFNAQESSWISQESSDMIMKGMEFLTVIG